MFYNQGSSISPTMVNKDRVSYPKPQGGNGSGFYVARCSCVKCEKKNDCECLANTDGCFGFGNIRHEITDCLVLMDIGRERNQDPPCYSKCNAPQQKRFYALQNRGEEDDSANVITNMLKISINICMLC